METVRNHCQVSPESKIAPDEYTGLSEPALTTSSIAVSGVLMGKVKICRKAFLQASPLMKGCPIKGGSPI